jgi:hypothetical protein
MCAVSMIMEGWRQPMSPNFVPWPTVVADPMLAQQMLEVLKRLEALDKRLGLMEQCKVSMKDKKNFKAKLARVAKKR